MKYLEVFSETAGGTIKIGIGDNNESTPLRLDNSWDNS